MKKGRRADGKPALKARKAALGKAKGVGAAKK